MTKFQNPSFSVGPKAGEQITEASWEQVFGNWKDVPGYVAEGCTTKATASQYGVSTETIKAIASGRNWKATKAKGKFDGGSSHNPGEAAWAFAIEYDDATGFALTGALGISTNNRSEYAGLIELLKYALAHGVTELVVEGDSKLVIEQVKGNWKVKDAQLKPLAEEAKALVAKFEKITLAWIPREENDECDGLVKGTIKNIGHNTPSTTSSES